MSGNSTLERLLEEQETLRQRYNREGPKTDLVSALEEIHSEIVKRLKALGAKL